MVEKEKSITSIYMVHVKLCKEKVNAAKDTYSDLWHTRFGHLSEKGLNILAKKFFP